MSWKEDIRFQLLGASGVASRIGNRLYPRVAPQPAELPYGVYQAISARRSYTMGGQSAVATPRVQIDWWADRESDVVALADAARRALSGWRTTGTDGVLGVFLVDEQDRSTDPAEGSDRIVYGVTQDYEVHHVEVTA